MSDRAEVSSNVTPVGEDMTVVERARQAGQDLAARHGRLHTQPDAYVMGEIGLAAVRVVLEHLLEEAQTFDVERYPWHTHAIGADKVESLLKEAADA